MMKIDLVIGFFTVESSKFITEKKNWALVDKLTTPTSEADAANLKWNLHT